MLSPKSLVVSLMYPLSLKKDKSGCKGSILLLPKKSEQEKYARWWEYSNFFICRPC